MFNSFVGKVVKKLKGREVKNMKKLFAIVLAVALAMSMPVSAFAAFTSDGASATTATVSPTTGSGAIITTFSAALKKISDNTAATSITWTGVQAQNTDWKSADQYIETQGFETNATWGIQVFTDNKGALTALPTPAPNPLYTGVAGTDPAGLVKTTDTTKVIPMCWRVVADKKLTSASEDGKALGIVQKYIATIDSYVLLRVAADYVSDTNFFAPWGFMLDKSTPDVKAGVAGDQPFGDYQTYASIAGNFGITVAPGDPDVSGAGTYLSIPTQTSKYNIYVGAKFLNATGGATYTTNRLIVQMYHL